jgi:hypothetical protein
MLISSLKSILVVMLAITIFERQVCAWIPSHVQSSTARQNWRSHVSGIMPQKGGRGALFTPLESAKSLSIALDRSVVPRGIFGGNVAAVAGFTLLISQVLKSRVRSKASGGSAHIEEYQDEYEDDYEQGLLPALLEKLGDKAKEVVSRSISVAKVPFVAAWMFMKLCVKVLFAKVALMTEIVSSFVNEFIEFDPADIVDIKDWKICVLDERELMEGDIVRYRFELANDNAMLPVSIGQEVVMCAIDSRDKVLKGSFFPVSKTSDRGFFEVLVDRKATDADSGGFGRNLDTLALGDEVAFKGGRHRLNYMGNEPIYGVSVAASHLGIAPSLQILRGILGDQKSSVEDSELLWLNEDERYFACEEEVEELEYKHIEKLAVSRIVEEDLYAAAFARNELIQDAVTPYDEGRLGVICAPDYVVPGLRRLFQDLGYPSDNILTVPVS